MTDHRRLLGQLADDRVEMVRHLPHRLPGEDLRMCLGVGDGFRVIRPAGLHGRKAGILEVRRPAVPAARQQPESVDENDRGATGLVGSVDLL
jgi:hypothetical protein